MIWLLGEMISYLVKYLWRNYNDSLGVLCIMGLEIVVMLFCVYMVYYGFDFDY